MSRWLLPAALSALVVIAAVGVVIAVTLDPPTTVPTVTDTANRGSGDLEAGAAVGLDEAAAQSLADERGWTVRVVSRDGTTFPVTLDYHPGRLNLSVEDRRIVGAYLG